MGPDDVYVFLHSCPQRDNDRQRAVASLERSDAAGAWVLERQPEGCLPMDHWRDAMLRAAQSGARLVVRIEDDVVVAPRLRSAIAKWAVTESADFGVGQLAAIIGREALQQGYVVRHAKHTARFDVSRERKNDITVAWGEVFPAECIAKMLDEVWNYEPYHVIWRKGEWFCEPAADLGMRRLGRARYLHMPYIVWADDVRDRSLYFPRGNAEIFRPNPYVKLDFDPDVGWSDPPYI